VTGKTAVIPFFSAFFDAKTLNISQLTSFTGKELHPGFQLLILISSSE